jgi:diguanylate cyclase (GGDEF)-like protein
MADIFTAQGYSHPVIPYWNLVVTLGVFVIVSASLHQLKESLRNANELARTDTLTGCANRRAFFEIAGNELKRMNRYKRPFTIAYLDLDEFKHVNDNLGHEAGDNLLRCVADAIKADIRSSDLLARIGGDEFVMLLPETNEDQAQSVVQKLAASLQSALQKENWAVSYSMGVVTYIRPPATVDDMLVKADHMMYAAKREGKNKVRFLVWKESAIVR